MDDIKKISPSLLLSARLKSSEDKLEYNLNHRSNKKAMNEGDLTNELGLGPKSFISKKSKDILK